MGRASNRAKVNFPTFWGGFNSTHFITNWNGSSFWTSYRTVSSWRNKSDDLKNAGFSLSSFQLVMVLPIDKHTYICGSLPNGLTQSTGPPPFLWLARDKLRSLPEFRPDCIDPTPKGFLSSYALMMQPKSHFRGCGYPDMCWSRHESSMKKE